MPQITSANVANANGTLRLSPDGAKVLSLTSTGNTGKLREFTFNAATGDLLERWTADIPATGTTNGVTYPIGTNLYSADYSPSGAKIYLSLFKQKDPEALLETIRLHTKEIRKELGNRIRNQVRIIPDLHFFIDDSLDYAETINNIMKNIVIPPAPEEDKPE